MQEAKIGLFEDHPLAREMLTEWLNNSGHSVTMVADSLPAALAAIAAAPRDAIDVALVDADLGVSHAEGHEVAQKIRQKMARAAIIGISAGHEIIIAADVNIPKGRVDEIVEYIAKL